MSTNRQSLRDQAIVDGYKDETCAKCGTLFEAHVHFIRCEARPCPMISTKDPCTLFERMDSAPGEEAKP